MKRAMGSSLSRPYNARPRCDLRCLIVGSESEWPPTTNKNVPTAARLSGGSRGRSKPSWWTVDFFSEAAVQAVEENAEGTQRRDSVAAGEKSPIVRR